MKKLSKTLIAGTFAAMLFSSATLFAQVKIGTNPTTIEATSNLEVEASTPNRQVKVDKTTGQLTIKDGTEGTGKVLISDANGGAAWTLLTSAFRMTSITDQGITSGTGVYYLVTFTAAPLDQDAGCTTGASSRYTVKQAGTYTVLGSINFYTFANTGASLRIFKNGSFLKNVGITAKSMEANAIEISLVDSAVVGDYYELKANNNTGGMIIQSADLNGTRIK
ncbi:hypothetical protein DYBT9275_02491 [Dyadobacter sp. CECT 9275]|uniref:C1q domain-containing protein n=1 Tax=Dyadobacter helix TaxID=2822344 RepID=A0A916N4H4_9BACT|nr:hypothetical protein [Dyadobacter sp. CECT 9275]CAG5000580.1 hypothetical protein DYBT9275_02491 [Dyadobacter sp. CECT 9275]